MYAVQSALAIKRAREKRASRSGPVAQIPADVKRELLKPPEQKGSLTYFNVGVAFTLLGKILNIINITNMCSDIYQEMEAL